MSLLPLPSPDKSLGQHFLREPNIIHEICSNFKDQAEAILEIGPGPGILTEHLAHHQVPFLVIEKDERFPPYLEQFISPAQITIADALKVNLSQFLLEKNLLNKKTWLVSNLPYNVGSPLLINFLQTPELKFMTLMFQKEVADKVFPFATTKNFMNSLLVLSQSYFECELLCKVPPGAFSPPPKVESAVLSMIRREVPLVPLSEFKTLEIFLRLVFAHKRKQLGGILKSAYELKKIETIFQEENILLTVRAEALSLDQILALYRKFKK
jgi:16S rRNA (adenine1518-N6/adenine1519-N6)-dimethyltransferase